MSIKADNIKAVVLEPDTFPLLRQFKSDTNVIGPLVVLFTTATMGVALAGVPPCRIGVPEIWVHYTDKRWSCCSITLTSVH